MDIAFGKEWKDILIHTRDHLHSTYRMSILKLGLSAEHEKLLVIKLAKLRRLIYYWTYLFNMGIVGMI